jgi:hypothetical protein
VMPRNSSQAWAFALSNAMSSGLNLEL